MQEVKNKQNMDKAKWISLALFWVMVCTMSFKNGYKSLTSFNLVSVVMGNAIEVTPALAVFSMILMSVILTAVINGIGSYVYGGISRLTPNFKLTKYEFLIRFKVFIIVENVILGLIGLLYFMQPIIYVAGGVALELLGSAGVLIAFFIYIKKKYLTPVIAPMAFMMLAIPYLAYAMYIVMMGI